jgi:hypothetical protein
MGKVEKLGVAYRWAGAVAITLVLLSVLVAAQARGVESS